MNRAFRPLIIIVVGYLILKFGIPFIGAQMHPGTWPVIPATVMKMYMTFVVIGALLINSFDEGGYSALADPVISLYGDSKKAIPCYAVMTCISLFGAFVAYQYVKPTFDAPVELRSVHPAPPSSVKIWGKTYNLATLTNPLREDKANWDKTIEAGGKVYYKNCFYCHGDRMLGFGHYAVGLNPRPADFVDVGTIAQLTESFVFWRVATGGPGLPSEGTPWATAMPVWNQMLNETEIWQVISFLYEYTGHSPRVTASTSGKHGE